MFYKIRDSRDSKNTKTVAGQKMFFLLKGLIGTLHFLYFFYSKPPALF